MSATGKFKKHVDRPHLPGGFDHFPIQLQTIGIEQAHPASKLFPANLWKNFLQQNAVTVTFVKMDILALLRELSQQRYLLPIYIDEMILTERRAD
jgi:hypothetical protein